jgi:putative transcriptional regulator
VDRRPWIGHGGAVDPGVDEGAAVGLSGMLLVAAPELEQPEFARTVVLLLEHTREGAVGVVLNRPREDAVASRFPDWATAPVVAEPRVLFSGGPVEPDAVLLVALATDEDRAAGRAATSWRVVMVPFGDAPEDAAEWAEGVRLFAGYAGWGAGQLEVELSVGAWYVVESQPDDLVASRPAELWRSVLRRQGGDLALVSGWTPEPELN